MIFLCSPKWFLYYWNLLQMSNHNNHLVCKRRLNNLAKLAKLLSCVVSAYLYSAFDGMFLSCHAHVSEWIKNIKTKKAWSSLIPNRDHHPSDLFMLLISLIAQRFWSWPSWNYKNQPQILNPHQPTLNLRSSSTRTKNTLTHTKIS